MRVSEIEVTDAENQHWAEDALQPSIHVIPAPVETRKAAMSAVAHFTAGPCVEAREIAGGLTSPESSRESLVDQSFFHTCSLPHAPSIASTFHSSSLHSSRNSSGDIGTFSHSSSGLGTEGAVRELSCCVPEHSAQLGCAHQTSADWDDDFTIPAPPCIGVKSTQCFESFCDVSHVHTRRHVWEPQTMHLQDVVSGVLPLLERVSAVLWRPCVMVGQCSPGPIALVSTVRVGTVSCVHPPPFLCALLPVTDGPNMQARKASFPQPLRR